MSRTIVILETPGEYRVKALDSPEMLYLGINANTSKWIPNSKFIHETFDDETTWYFKEAALSHARELVRQGGNAELEGGIRVIDIWSDIEYPNL